MSTPSHLYLRVTALVVCPQAPFRACMHKQTRSLQRRVAQPLRIVPFPSLHVCYNYPAIFVLPVPRPPPQDQACSSETAEAADPTLNWPAISIPSAARLDSLPLPTPAKAGRQPNNVPDPLQQASSRQVSDSAKTVPVFSTPPSRRIMGRFLGRMGMEQTALGTARIRILCFFFARVRSFFIAVDSAS